MSAGTNGRSKGTGGRGEADCARQGSSQGCEAAGAGKKAAAVHEASHEDVEDAESKGQVAKAHVRIMCVSYYHVLCNDVCTYHVCPRLVGSFDYCAPCTYAHALRVYKHDLWREEATSAPA